MRLVVLTFIDPDNSDRLMRSRSLFVAEKELARSPSKQPIRRRKRRHYPPVDLDRARVLFDADTHFGPLDRTWLPPGSYAGLGVRNAENLVALGGTLATRRFPREPISGTT